MGLFWAKYARRIFAIVSTTSIPNLAPVSPTEATVDPPSRGSRLDADHPENGVLIPRRFTDRLHLGYFAGYTQWIYLNAPFIFTLPGVATEEVDPVRKGAERWRALRVTLSPEIASHTAVQIFYYNEDFLQQRHDYTLDVAGGCNVA